jgi:putative oxidoreductase
VLVHGKIFALYYFRIWRLVWSPTRQGTEAWMWNSLWHRVGPATHALLRIGAALLFMEHGVQKLFGWLDGFGEAGGTAPLISLMGLAGVLEVFGGLLILIGLLTRPVALVLVIQMLAAYVIAHMPQGGFPIQNQGELALLYGLVFAFLFGNGAGPFSIDAWLDRRRSARLVPAVAEPVEERAVVAGRRPAAAPPRAWPRRKGDRVS